MNHREFSAGQPPATAMSRLAVVCFALSLAVFTPLSALGLVLGLAAWLHLRNHPELAGAGLVRLAIFLGGISLWCQFWALPVALYAPPLGHNDLQLQRHLSDLGEGRYEDAYYDADWPISRHVGRLGFYQWADQFNEENGLALLVWGKKRVWNENRAQYLVYFQKTGFRTLELSWDNVGRLAMVSLDSQPLELPSPVLDENNSVCYRP